MIVHAYRCETDPVTMMVGEEIDPTHGSPPAHAMSGRTHCPVCGKSLSYVGSNYIEVRGNFVDLEENAQVAAPAPAPRRRGRPRKLQPAEGA
jgi:hypothetical protein